MKTQIQRLLNSKTLRNSNWLVFGGVSTAAISFVTSAVVAQFLSVADFGLLQLCLTVFAFMQFGENLVFPTVFKKELLERPGDKQKLYAAGMQIILIYSLLAIAVSLIASFVVSSPIPLLIAILSVGLLFRSSNVISFNFDASLQSRVTQSYQLVALVLSSVARMLLAISGFGVLWQIIGVPIQYTVSSLLHFRSDAVSRQAFLRVGRVERDLVVSLVKKSAPFLFVGIFGLVLYRVDILILGWLGTSEQVGLYSVAVKLSEPWLFIGTAISTSFFPLLVKARAAGPTRYYLMIGRLFWLLTGIAIVISLGVYVFSDLIVSTIYPKYTGSAAILRVHTWSVIFLFLYSLHHIWDVCEGLSKLAIFRSASAAVLNIVLNLILIPRLGAVACAWSSLASYFFYGYGFNLFHRKGRFLLKQELLKLPSVLRSVRTTMRAP